MTAVLRRASLTAATLVAGLLILSNGAASASAPTRQIRDSVPGIPGLPSGVPPAATASPATLPAPSRTTWPFPSDFSHTEGTGRLNGGATLWTDFVYDDHGPFGSPVGMAQAEGASDLAPVHGGFTYPSGPANQNGADIFTAAVGYAPGATYWRVDWNTLVDPKVPVAEWTMSGADRAPGTATAWPGNAGVSTSSGIQYALIVTAKQAELVKAADPDADRRASHERGHELTLLHREDPNHVLPVSGTWKVQLAAGLADPTDTQFATVPPADGGIGNGVNVYNVTFRTYKQESELVCPTGPFPILASPRQCRADWPWAARPTTTSRSPSAATSGWRTTRPTRWPAVMSRSTH